jgi:hypothetical protein
MIILDTGCVNVKCALIYAGWKKENMEIVATLPEYSNYLFCFYFPLLFLIVQILWPLSCYYYCCGNECAGGNLL